MTNCITWTAMKKNLKKGTMAWTFAPNTFNVNMDNRNTSIGAYDIRQITDNPPNPPSPLPKTLPIDAK